MSSDGCLDKALRHGRVALCYSGGKDSTALALLLLDRLSEIGGAGIEVVVLYVDTLSEYQELREWVHAFMNYYVSELQSLGAKASIRVIAPAGEDTFYYRVAVMGYAAPSFKFRWCQNLLKVKPTTRAISQLRGYVLLLGHRESESQFRRKLLSRVAPGATIPYVLFASNGLVKAYPIRSWTEDDVFSYLYRKSEEHPILTRLFELYCYGFHRIRYGCWHCTLARWLEHPLLQSSVMAWLEAARVLYRLVSDIKELRNVKRGGYSFFGYLQPPARALLIHSWLAVEKRTGVRLYGLDEGTVSGVRLRELLFSLDPREAEKVVVKVTPQAVTRGFRSVKELDNSAAVKLVAEAVLKELDRVKGRTRREMVAALLDETLSIM